MAEELASMGLYWEDSLLFEEELPDNPFPTLMELRFTRIADSMMDLSKVSFSSSPRAYSCASKRHKMREHLKRAVGKSFLVMK